MAASREADRPTRAPKPVRLKGSVRLDMQDIEAAIGGGRDQLGPR
jgi:hypothetical protein